MFYITIYPHQTPNHTKTILPPHLETNFLIDSGAKFNIINNDIWIEIKEYQDLKLKTFINICPLSSK